MKMKVVLGLPVFLFLCSMPGCVFGELVDYHEDVLAISGGQGGERVGWREDHFSRLLRLMREGDPYVRWLIAHDFNARTTLVGGKNPVLIDVYIDANRGLEAVVALEEGWRHEGVKSDQRTEMRDSFIEDKVRYFLRDHPKNATEMGINPVDGNAIGGMANSDSGNVTHSVVMMMIQGGDKDLEEAWREREEWIRGLSSRK